MKVITVLHSLVLAASAIGLFAGAANAGSQTFANFSETGTQGFVFTNSGSTSSFTSTAFPVEFYYTEPNSYGPLVGGSTAEIPAYLVITGAVNAQATEDGNGIIDQSFGAITMDFTNALGQNLLTVNDQVGGIGTFPGYAGADSGESGGVSSSTSAKYPQAVSYTSSFLNFNNVTEDNFALSFSSLLDTDPPGAGPTINANGYLDSFAASGTGTFADTSVVTTPEPNPALTLSIAACGLLAIGVLRKKSAQTF